MPTAAEITRHHDPTPDENPWVKGPPPPEKIEIVNYDTGWPEVYERLAAAIRQALGTKALGMDHVGSTSVPGLAAKPVIDIDLAVADPSDEAAYLPELETLGYELVIREPSWHQHRCLRLHSPRVNLHVFGPDCPEAIRHRLFRDWLRENPADRQLYEQAKLRALQGVDRVMDYNLAKQPVIQPGQATSDPRDLRSGFPGGGIGLRVLLEGISAATHAPEGRKRRAKLRLSRG